MDCLFCKIIKGDIPSYTIYENDYVKCFLDINPIQDGHTLIIPKKHFLDINDIDEEYLNNVLLSAKEVVKKIQKNLEPDGVKLVQNNGSLQEIKHFHLHIIPSYNEKKEKRKVEDIFNIITK